MSVSRRSIIAVSLAALAAASLIVLASALARPFTVVAYRLGERDLGALRVAVSAYAEAGGSAPRVLAARPRSSLASLASGPWKPDLVVFSPGAESSAAASRFEPPPPGAAALVSRPLLAALSSGERAYGLPLALDPLELAWSRPAFAAAGLAPPLGAPAFEAACRALAPGSRGVLLVAGGDDATLLALVSQLVAERHGLAAYDALAAALAGGKSPGEAAAASLPSREGGTTSLAETLGELAAWDRAGWLPSGWLGFGRGTALNYLKTGQASLVIELLSQRRSVDYATIGDFGSARLGLHDPRPDAPMAARVAAAAIPAGARHAGQAARLRGFLLSEKGQTVLATSMGAAPAASAAAAPDFIAHDARSRAQASERLLGGLAADSGTDPARLAAWLRDYILAEERK